MTWLKIDDGILENDKVAAAGPIGFALCAAGIVYSGRNLTDGFIPYGHARRLLATSWTENTENGKVKVYKLAATCGMSGIDGEKLIEQIIELLCVLNLWHEVDHGYEINDYLDYNPSRAEVEALRGARQAAGQAGGIASATARAKASAIPSGQARPKAKSNPVPVPVPLTSNEVNKSVTNVTESYVSGGINTFADTWNANCSPLPKLRKPPTRPTEVKLVEAVLAHYDQDIDLLGRAIDQCSRDSHYRDNRYGWVTFARHLERWDGSLVETRPSNPIDARIWSTYHD